MDTDVVVEVESLQKRFGEVTAIGDLSFRVRRGQVYGLLGPNGAGKTTTLRVLTGLERPSGGEARLFGTPVRPGTPSLTRVGALGLLVFLIPTTVIFHDFWNLAGPERAMQMVNFLKNLAIMGGLTLLIADGPGRFAFDTAIRRSRVTVD